MKKCILLAIAAGCSTQVSANVDCKVEAGPVIACTAKQTTDKDVSFEVCWDFSVECANKASLVAERTCATLTGTAPAQVTIPTEKIKITGSCEGEKTPKLGNMVITGK
jgi:hypothetical protein